MLMSASTFIVLVRPSFISDTVVVVEAVWHQVVEHLEDPAVVVGLSSPR